MNPETADRALEAHTTPQLPFRPPKPNSPSRARRGRDPPPVPPLTAAPGGGPCGDPACSGRPRRPREAVPGPCRGPPPPPPAGAAPAPPFPLLSPPARPPLAAGAGSFLPAAPAAAASARRSAGSSGGGAARMRGGEARRRGEAGPEGATAPVPPRCRPPPFPGWRGRARRPGGPDGKFLGTGGQRQI